MKNSSLYLAVSFVLGVLIGGGTTYAIFSRSDETVTSATSSAVMDHSSMGTGAQIIQQMNSELMGKTGDDFDRLFISMMIQHHQGAIEMAKQAQQRAGHSELKTMADGIISAQADEIDQMRGWRRLWDY